MHTAINPTDRQKDILPVLAWNNISFPKEGDQVPEVHVMNAQLKAGRLHNGELARRRCGVSLQNPAKPLLVGIAHLSAFKIAVSVDYREAISFIEFHEKFLTYLASNVIN